MKASLQLLATTKADFGSLLVSMLTHGHGDQSQGTILDMPEAPTAAACPESANYAAEFCQ